MKLNVDQAHMWVEMVLLFRARNHEKNVWKLPLDTEFQLFCDKLGISTYAEKNLLFVEHDTDPLGPSWRYLTHEQLEIFDNARSKIGTIVRVSLRQREVLQVIYNRLDLNLIINESGEWLP